MSEKRNYLKVLIEIADSASKTYNKYQKYQSSPEELRKDDPQLYSVFKVTEGIFGNLKDLINKDNNSYTIPPRNDNNYDKGSIREKHYKILDCIPSDTNEKVKDNYKKMVKKFHPDSISGKDLPEEFIEFANQKFKEVQISYEYIKRERNL